MKNFILLMFIFSLKILFSQQYTIEQYLNIRGAGSPQYSPDDSRIYFTSSVTGSSQIWMMEKPASWPFQVTFFNDRVSSYSCNPKQDMIVLEKDEGGSEYSRLFLLSPDGTKIEQITPDKPKVLYNFGTWFDDGSAFTYYSNERDLYFYDIYKYDLNKREIEQIFSSDNSNYPSVISSDGKLMVISRFFTSYDNDLLLYNLETKEQSLITLHDNINYPAEFEAISFSKDSKSIFINTNNKGEYYSLFEYDLQSGKMRSSELPFAKTYKKNDLSWAQVSEDKSKIFLVYNVDGYDKPVMYDFETKKTIELPSVFKNTNITSFRFGNVSTKILIGINGAKNPTTLYQWDYASNQVMQVTYADLAGIDPASFVEPQLIHYKTFDKLSIPAFIYYPPGFENKANLPCIISVHGGPEGQSQYGFSSTTQYYVNAGYVVVEPNVRGSTGYGKSYAALDNIQLRENSVKDIAWLVKYLKTTGKIDSNKIAVTGGSYGGYMVLACLTLYPELFAAGIDVVGIANFITFLQNTAEYRRKGREGEYGSLEKNADFLESISPVKKVDKIKAPLMIVHGKNDPRVPVGEAEQMYEAIKKKGGEAELLIYNDEGHGLAKLKNRLDAYPKMVEFFDKYVKNK